MWDIKALKKEFNLNQLYKEYNAKYFNGELGDIVFDVYEVGDGDIFSYAYENARKKRTGKYEANIKFNAKCVWNDENIRETLLHEMIHYHIFIKIGRCPLFAHGVLFKLEQLRLWFRYGLHVPTYGRCKMKKVD